MSAKSKYKVGDVFGQRVISGFAGYSNNTMLVVASCSCGRTTQTMQITNLVGGKTKRCMLCRKENYLNLDDNRDGFSSKVYTPILLRLQHQGAGLEQAKAICKTLSKLGIVPENLSRIDTRECWSATNFFITDNSKRRGMNPNKNSIYLQSADKAPTYVVKRLINGKREVKAFAIKKYGEEEAKRLAEEVQQKWMEETIAFNRVKAIEQGILEA